MGGDDTRNLTLLPDSDAGPVHRGRHIVAVIGIDAYACWRKLNNAVSDAKGVQRMFTEGLGFRELVPPLFDAEATQQAITSRLLDELAPQLEPDDSLVVFFAGHGHTEAIQLGAKKVKTGYLIPVEGRLPQERKFSAYIELDSFLKNLAKLPARHVLLILDACYSGFALGSSVEVLRSYERYTDDLGRRLSRRVITSAMEDQPALDTGPIPGHSLFTGTLIEGIGGGRADAETKGFVTSSELALYLQKTVGSASDSRQTPDFGSFALDDRGELVLALRGETFNKAQARECLEVAEAVYALGWICDDAKRFQSSIREYRRALEFANLAKAVLPQAELGLGKALWATGDAVAAITCLSGLIEREAEQAPAEARFYLGLAYAKSGGPAAAARSLGEWLSRNPQHADAGWVGVYIDWLNRVRGGTPAGRKRALLIGIDRYTMRVPELRGCVNDVARLMRPLLAHWGFQDQDIVLLKDEEATRERFLAELEKLERWSRPEDPVLVHFSGHSVPSSRPDIFGPNERENVYLLLHDTHNRQGFLENGVSADELHQRLQAIPALRKMIVLDTHASQPLVDLAEREGTYALILASDTAEIAYEWSVEVEGQKLACGMLTGALYQAGMDLRSEDSTYDHWIAPAIRISQEASSNAALYPNRQTPLFVGQRNGSVFGEEDFLLPLFEFSLRRQWPEMTASQLIKRYRSVSQSLSFPHPQAHLAFGRALLSKGEYAAAVEALNMAAAQVGREDRAVLLPLMRAHLGAGDLARAADVCRRLSAGAEDADRAALAGLLAQMEAMGGSRREAVLVGIDRYRSRKLPGLKGAANDARAMHQILVERWGFAPEDVTLLCDKAANREAIVSEFKRIARVSRRETAVFYFAGLGSTDPQRLPTIVSHDGRTKGVEDIAVKELAELAGREAVNLIVILDAGFGFGTLWSTEERSIRPDERSAAKTSSFPNDEDRRRFLKDLKIGAFNVLHAPERW